MQQDILKMSEIDIRNKRVIIREDLNVPIKNGKINDESRILRALPTIKQALSQKARVIILSHLGNPEEGKYNPNFSLYPISVLLSKLLQKNVYLIDKYLERKIEIQPGEVALLENTRFNIGEKKNCSVLSKKIASLCDVFVMDAFATAHRSHASTLGISRYVKLACAGPLLTSELTQLSKEIKNKKSPVVAIIGGSKISTKLGMLERILDMVDFLLVGGGIANTFLKATGHEIGESLYEKEFLYHAIRILNKAKKNKVCIPLPIDARVRNSRTSDTHVVAEVDIKGVSKYDAILDIGSKTEETYKSIIHSAKTIIWNGPVGVFEDSEFSGGTRTVGEAIASSDAYSIAGGGDTVSAINFFNLYEKIKYISTGGGAFMHFLERGSLPSVDALMTKQLA